MIYAVRHSHQRECGVLRLDGPSTDHFPSTRWLLQLSIASKDPAQLALVLKMRSISLVAAACLLCCVHGFVILPVPAAAKASQGPTAGAVVLRAGMAQPEVQTKTTTKQETLTRQRSEQKQKVRTFDPISRREEEYEDPPMYKLMLLGDDSYDKEHVVTRLCVLLEDLDEDRATEIFQQAQASGKAMAGVYPFEKAELFKEQLLRSTPMIMADMTEEKK